MIEVQRFKDEAFSEAHMQNWNAFQSSEKRFFRMLLTRFKEMDSSWGEKPTRKTNRREIRDAIENQKGFLNKYILLIFDFQ